MGDRWTARTAADRGAVDHRQPRPRRHPSDRPARRRRDGAEGLHRLLRSVLSNGRCRAATASRRVASAYAEVGMRAVIAPMVADRTFMRRSPASADASAAALQRARRGVAPAARRGDAGRHPLGIATIWSLDRDRVRPAVAPTIPHHCSDDFILAAPTLRARLRSRPAQPCRRVEGAGGRRHAALRQDPDRASRRASACWGRNSRSRTASGSTMTTWPGSAIMAPRLRHNPGSNMRLGARARRCPRDARSGGSISASAPMARSCSDNQNMYEAMRLASFVSKVQGRSGAAG